MAYRRLSEQLRELPDPQRSDAFIRRFKEAVRDGRVEAAYVPERFTMPKEFKRRGAEGSYQRDARELVFEVTPEFEAWFEETSATLAADVRTRGGQPKPSLENIEAGAVDFKALAEQTRLRMQASFEKGQALGQRRSGGASKGSKAKAPARGKAKTTKTTRSKAS